MRLIHYSRAPLSEVRSCEQDEGRDGWKPRGLWVSVEGETDWLNWCRSEGFALDRFSHGAEIILAADANILRLAGAREIDEFTAEYAAPHPILGMGLHATIDWKRVAQKHQGIIIAPYIYSRRMAQHTFWYYPWDCASGCIWDAAAVAELRPAEIRVAEGLKA